MMKICELLDDGQWHPIAEIVTEAGWLIPPGKAIRLNERERGIQSPGDRYVQRSTSRLVQSGRRSVVRQTMKTKWFEKDKAGSSHDPPTFVRMTQLPPHVVRERFRQKVEAMMKGDMQPLVDGDPEEILSEAYRLRKADVLAIAIELASREKERALSARLLME